MPRKSQEAEDEQKGGGISLSPLTFGEAVAALLGVKPDAERPKKRGKKRSKLHEREQSDD